MDVKYFPGLNSLRFFAALLVMMTHGYQTVVKMGYIHEVTGTVIFERGPAAVVETVISRPALSL